MNQPIEFSPYGSPEVTHTIAGFYPVPSYWSGLAPDQENAMAAFLNYGEDLIEEVPFAESALVEYRQRNEIC